VSAIDTNSTVHVTSQTRREGPPRSATAPVTGLLGLAGLLLGMVIVMGFKINAGAGGLIVLSTTMFGMLFSTVFIEKTWKNPTTGLDFSRPRSHAETMETAKVKLAGLAVTFAALGFLYFVISHYTMARYGFFFLTMTAIAAPGLMFGFVYVYFVDKHMIEPKDHLWHFGAFICGQREDVDMEEVAGHLRAWAVKGFFIAFMLSIVPGVVSTIINFDFSKHAQSPVAWGLLAIALLFLVDVIFATPGYLITFRLLDLHIRTANPFLFGWVAALVCYPPFIVMGRGGILDYHAGGAYWHVWLADHPALLWLWAFVLVALIFVYAAATVAFGLRFSNLTNRGTITSWPYSWFKHPAYISKNLYWWLAAMPFLSTLGAASAFRCSVLLLFVNLIYYARAKTEEKHMMEDANYRAYVAWIAEHGVLERFGRWIKIRLYGQPETREQER